MIQKTLLTVVAIGFAMSAFAGETKESKTPTNTYKSTEQQTYQLTTTVAAGPTEIKLIPSIYERKMMSPNTTQNKHQKGSAESAQIADKSNTKVTK